MCKYNTSECELLPGNLLFFQQVCELADLTATMTNTVIKCFWTGNRQSKGLGEICSNSTKD